MLLPTKTTIWPCSKVFQRFAVRSNAYLEDATKKGAPSALDRAAAARVAKHSKQWRLSRAVLCVCAAAEQQMKLQQEFAKWWSEHPSASMEEVRARQRTQHARYISVGSPASPLYVLT